MEEQQRADHDVLIEVKTILQELSKRFDYLSNSTIKDVEALKRDMVDRKALEKIEGTVHEQTVSNETEHDNIVQRINTLENWRWFVLGVTAVFPVIINFIFKVYLK